MVRQIVDLNKMLEPAGATIALFAGRQLMDPYARQIFDLWFSGNAKKIEIFSGKKWSDYMCADVKLAKSISDALAMHARELRASDYFKDFAKNKKESLYVASYRKQFHGEVGSEFGGYMTGYEVLHGSNKNVGDCVITGCVHITRVKGSDKLLNFKYSNHFVVFNDMVDPNYSYDKDVTFDQIAKRMARALKQNPPRDYHIKILFEPSDPINVRVNLLD